MAILVRYQKHEPKRLGTSIVTPVTLYIRKKKYFWSKTEIIKIETVLSELNDHEFTEKNWRYMIDQKIPL